MLGTLMHVASSAAPVRWDNANQLKRACLNLGPEWSDPVLLTGEGMTEDTIYVRKDWMDLTCLGNKWKRVSAVCSTVFPLFLLLCFCLPTVVHDGP
jgi:hypothetical protein